MCLRMFIAYFVASTVHFEQSVYVVYENASVVQPVLILSNPSSSDITVKVTTSGEYYTICN